MKMLFVILGFTFLISSTSNASAKPCNILRNKISRNDQSSNYQPQTTSTQSGKNTAPVKTRT